jgi:hypothetical protein
VYRQQKSRCEAAFLWLKSAQWITASFLQVFALRQVLQQERRLHRQREQQERRLGQQQEQAQRWQVQAQQRGLVQVQELLLFCRKRSEQRQQSTGRRSTGSCSWFVQTVREFDYRSDQGTQGVPVQGSGEADRGVVYFKKCQAQKPLEKHARN